MLMSSEYWTLRFLMNPDEESENSGSNNNSNNENYPNSGQQYLDIYIINKLNALIR